MSTATGIPLTDSTAVLPAPPPATHRPPASVGQRPGLYPLHAHPALGKPCAPTGGLAGRPLSEAYLPGRGESDRFGPGGVAPSPRPSPPLRSAVPLVCLFFH